MPYYNGSQVATRSSLTQGSSRDCFVVAPVAAYNLTNLVTAELNTIRIRVGPRLGGTSDTTFRKLGLYPRSWGFAYRGEWTNIMRTAINNTIPLCIGIHWYNLLDDDTPDPDHQGNHVIYAIGYEGNHLYGRDQQHNQLLIKLNMGSLNKQSDIFVVGSRTRRRCEVKWLGVGCQNKNQARQLFS